MKKFRLVKQEDKNDNGETVTSFFIQKKWLFWWFRAVFEIHCCNYKYNASLTGRKYILSEEDSAREFFKNITDPFKLIYKGNRIKKVYSEYEQGWVYINLSNRYFWRGSITYEWSNSLEVLKKNIDQRISKKSIAVIA